MNDAVFSFDTSETLYLDERLVRAILKLPIVLLTLLGHNNGICPPQLLDTFVGHLTAQETQICLVPH